MKDIKKSTVIGLVNLKSIKNTGKEIELYFDTGTLRKENSDLIMIGALVEVVMV